MPVPATLHILKLQFDFHANILLSVQIPIRLLVTRLLLSCHHLPILWARLAKDTAYLLGHAATVCSSLRYLVARVWRVDVVVHVGWRGVERFGC